jgi:hypothetical protein
VNVDAHRGCKKIEKCNNSQKEELPHNKNISE